MKSISEGRAFIAEFYGSTQVAKGNATFITAAANWESSFYYTSCLTRIPVHTPSRSYDVLVQRGLLRSAESPLRSLIPKGARVFVVTPPPIRKHWLKPLRKSFSKAGWEVEVLVMPDGERAKTLAQLENLAGQMVKAGGDRQSVLLALGGGVVGDVGGFLASVFMRGVPVVQIPTTLLAQVDSAIGGKTGAGKPKSGKNLLGTFHQPLAVLVDPDVLATLPEREYRSGCSRAMKYWGDSQPCDLRIVSNNTAIELLRRDGDPAGDS